MKKLFTKKAYWYVVYASQNGLTFREKLIIQ
jgi:hypothetical protein